MNERIRALDTRFGVTDTTCLLLCECDHPGCTGNVEVPVAVHAEACARPGRFIVIPGHEPGEEAVLARTATYAVVAYEPGHVASVPDASAAEPASPAGGVSVDPSLPADARTSA